MRRTLEDQISEAKSLLDVLLILKQKTLLDTHVATLAYLDTNFKKFDGNFGIWECRPFPLNENQKEFRIQAYYFSQEGDNFVQGSKVLIVFTDQNFINNLYTGGTPVETKDQILHSLKYGVIVSLPGLELSPAEEEEILDF